MRKKAKDTGEKVNGQGKIVLLHAGNKEVSERLRRVDSITISNTVFSKQVKTILTFNEYILAECNKFIVSESISIGDLKAMKEFCEIIHQSGTILNQLSEK